MIANQYQPALLEETLILEEVYGKAIDQAASRSAKLVGLGAKKTHDAIENLLGGPAAYNEVVGNEKTISPDVRQRILAKMIETNAGIHHLLKDVIKKPEDEYVILSATGIHPKLSSLISDPQSEDARILAWYFNNVATNIEKNKAFEYIQNHADARKLENLLKVRSIYDALLADDENIDLDQKIKDVGVEITKAQAKIAADEAQVTKLTPGSAAEASLVKEIEADKASVARMTAQTTEHNRKKKEVERKLQEVAKFATTVVPATLAGELNKIEFDKALHAEPDLTFAATTENFDKYFTDDHLRSWTDGLMETLRRNGTAKPYARDILKRVMTTEYRGRILDQAQRDQFIDHLKNIHGRSTSQVAGIGSTPTASAATATTTSTAASAGPTPSSPKQRSRWNPIRWATGTWAGTTYVAKKGWHNKGSIAAGAVLGGIFIPVPGVGSVIGAAAAPFVAKLFSKSSSSPNS